MRVSAKAEYACLALVELTARNQARPTQSDNQERSGNPIRIRSIAEATGVPLRFLVQILLQLKTAGLVTSVRGAAGGYQLTRSPESISLADIINAIDDRGSTSWTSSPGLSKVVPSPVVDALLSVWRDIQAEEQRLLDRLSLAELLRRSQHNGALVYQI